MSRAGPDDPVIITDGGGFDRLSLKIRAEDIALLRIPTTPRKIVGPYGDDGVRLDMNADGVVNEEDQLVGINFGVAQHYEMAQNL